MTTTEEDYDWYDIRNLGWARIIKEKPSGNVPGYLVECYDDGEETWVPRSDMPEVFFEYEKKLNFPSKTNNPFLKFPKPIKNIIPINK